VTGGWLRSDAAARLGVRIAPRYRLPGFPGAARLAAPLNSAIDVAAFRRLPKAILHPSYFRDPRTLPGGHPVVVTLFDLTHERFPGAARLGPERWKQSLCQHADRVLCISESTRRDAVERLGLPEHLLRVAPLGSRDWSDVTAQPIEGAPARVLLWVGPRYEYKNFAGALAALVSCTEARELALLCVGGGPLSTTELGRAAELGIARRIVQREASDAGLRWAYEHSEGLVYPSLWEGFGLPVLEALSLGVPVLTSNVASLPDVGGEAAFYADPASTDALAAALTHMLTEGRTPGRVAAGCAQAARFTWERCAALHDAVYAEFE
jgi:glycosyltransferase involved in cell wall biosynthesis